MKHQTERATIVETATYVFETEIEIPEDLTDQEEIRESIAEQIEES